MRVLTEQEEMARVQHLDKHLVCISTPEKLTVLICITAGTQDDPHGSRSYLAGGKRLTSPLEKVKHRRFGLQSGDGVGARPLSGSGSWREMASFTKSLALSCSSLALTLSQAAKLLTNAPYFCSERRLTRIEGQRSPNCTL